MRKQVFEQVISLGSTCRAKHQIQRVYGKYISRRSVFDWQITPIQAVAEYLRLDFTGFFEKADLQIVDGEVWNTRFGVAHPHEFPVGVTIGTYEGLYQSARESHDRWCARTRSLIANDLSTLFVFCLPIAQEDLGYVEIIKQHIYRLNPQKRFHILLPPDEEFGDDWRGNAELWANHLSCFQIKPPRRIRIRTQLYRWRANTRNLFRRRRKVRNSQRVQGN